jgi:hypothetical protein
LQESQKFTQSFWFANMPSGNPVPNALLSKRLRAIDYVRMPLQKNQLDGVRQKMKVFFF